MKIIFELKSLTVLAFVKVCDTSARARVRRSEYECLRTVGRRPAFSEQFFRPTLAFCKFGMLAHVFGGFKKKREAQCKVKEQH